MFKTLMLVGFLQLLMADAVAGPIQVVTYEKARVVPIVASTFHVTQIVFSKSETIESVQCGDTAAWMIDVQRGLNNLLFIKPVVTGSNTNMTVTTNRHNYYFHLFSLEKGKTVQTYAVQFIYPSVTDVSLPKIYSKKMIYHRHYSYSGDVSLLPSRVFDDGRLTYLQFRQFQLIPAIFSVDNAQGKEALVNFRRRGHTIILQMVTPQLTLRDGSHHVASIFNDALILQRRR